ncbi:hypothetical protein HDU96_001282, partial [Phlyctochytrium bullatum]
LAAAEDSVLCRACFGEGTGAASSTHVVAEDRDGNEEAGGAAKMRKRRVKKVTQSTPLKCDACSREIGWGGMRMVDAGSSREGEWMEPPFGVEAICDDCVYNFDFCTQCGGGGNFRTGKWRPRQFFPPGRRGCCLPHTRHGPLTDIQCMTFLCAPDGVYDIHFDPKPFTEKPNDRTMKLLFAEFHGRFPTNRELLKHRMDRAVELYKVSKMGFNATATWMARSMFLRTWEQLGKRLGIALKELEAFVFGDDGTVGDMPSTGQVRRYICTLDALKSSKKPGRKQQNAALAESDAQELCLAGFMLFQWHIPRRQLVQCQNAFIPRDIEVDDPISHVSFCISSVLKRIEREAKAEKLPLPVHCGMWILPMVGSILEPKLRAIGMRPLADYVSTLDEEERSVFDDAVHVYGIGEGIKEDFQYLFIGFDALRMRVAYEE